MLLAIVPTLVNARVLGREIFRVSAHDRHYNARHICKSRAPRDEKGGGRQATAVYNGRCEKNGVGRERHGGEYPGPGRERRGEKRRIHSLTSSASVGQEPTREEIDDPGPRAEAGGISIVSRRNAVRRARRRASDVNLAPSVFSSFLARP